MASGSTEMFRKQARKKLGTAFADKASDSLCRQLFRPMTNGIVVETIDTFTLMPLKPEIRQSDPATRRAVRQIFARQWKSAIVKATRSLRNELINDSNQQQRAQHESQFCWSNASILTFKDLRSLAELAKDPLISALDLPRPFHPEIAVTGHTTGIEPFRHRAELTGKGIVIAVIDGEVCADHPFLTGRVRQQADLSGEGWGKPHWHGTAVAGIIASNHHIYTGMAPQAIIDNYKLYATSPSPHTVDINTSVAIDLAIEDGADIINLSGGGPRIRKTKSREARSCETAWAVGIPVIKSAGNHGAKPNRLTIPAEADGIIVVGATDRVCQNLASYSSGGSPEAPSKPHLLAPGGTDIEGVKSCSEDGAFKGSSYGTSFAAPHISGVVALLLQRQPLSPDETLNLLIQKYCTTLPNVPAWAQGAGVIQMFR